jgi:hypothetical protein
MGETVIRFGANDIATYRVKCACGCSAEIPADRAAAAFSNGMTCPGCRNFLWEVGATAKALSDFHRAIESIKGFSNLALEFVVSKASIDGP